MQCPAFAAAPGLSLRDDQHEYLKERAVTLYMNLHHYMDVSVAGVLMNVIFLNIHHSRCFTCKYRSE